MPWLKHPDIACHFIRFKLHGTEGDDGFESGKHEGASCRLVNSKQDGTLIDIMLLSSFPTTLPDVPVKFLVPIHPVGVEDVVVVIDGEHIGKKLVVAAMEEGGLCALKCPPCPQPPKKRSRKPKPPPEIICRMPAEKLVLVVQR